MTEPAPMASRVSAAQLEALLEHHEDVRVLDVRTPGEFESAHIAGAYNIPLGELPTALAELHGVASRLVVVCQSGSRADRACGALLDAGIDGVELLEGGMAAWQQGGRQVRRGSHRWDLERQVRLVAGSLVAASVLASVRWPKARFLAGAVGTGLVVAAATNTCTMGLLLARLPYNRPQTAAQDASATARDLRLGSSSDAAVAAEAA